MTPSFARACSRISARPGHADALGKTGRDRARNGGSVRGGLPPSFELCRAWDGVARCEGEFSAAGPRDHGGGPVALSSLALGISVLLQGVSETHRTGFNATSKMGLF